MTQSSTEQFGSYLHKMEDVKCGGSFSQRVMCSSGHSKSTSEQSGPKHKGEENWNHAEDTSEKKHWKALNSKPDYVERKQNKNLGSLGIKKESDSSWT